MKDTSVTIMTIINVSTYTTYFVKYYAGTIYFNLEVFSLKQDERKDEDIIQGTK